MTSTSARLQCTGTDVATVVARSDTTHRELTDTTRVTDSEGWLRCVGALGLSLRSVSHLLSALGCDLSRMSVWRDV